MNKIFHYTSTFKTLGEQDDGSIDIKGSASTNGLDRAGDIIESDAWTKGGLENFKNNPIILFNHDYNKPIGRATGLEVNDKGLDISAKISKAAGDVKDLIKDGVSLLELENNKNVSEQLSLGTVLYINIKF